jgi:integrase
MKRALKKLRPDEILSARKPGRYSDGGNLVLDVDQNGNRSWTFRFNSPTRPDSRFPSRGRAREMYLCTIDAQSLADAEQSLKEARKAAKRYRKLLRKQVDPIDHRRAKQQEETLRAVIFGQTFKQYREFHSNEASEGDLKLIWNEPVKPLDTRMVLSVLKPIWYIKPPTAEFRRMQIEMVYDWARVEYELKRKNPARWKNHLERVLPSPTKIRPVQIYPSLPFTQIADFMTALRTRTEPSARALKFTVLTIVRSVTTFLATWDEIDPSMLVWTIPAERLVEDWMTVDSRPTGLKRPRPFRQPLSDEAHEILKEMAKFGRQGFIFKDRLGKPLDDKSMRHLLGQLGYSEFTVHGFRATFKSWATQRGDYREPLVELALGHNLGPYDRDMFEERRPLMQHWVKVCKGEDVGMPIDKARKAVTG